MQISKQGNETICTAICVAPRLTNMHRLKGVQIIASIGYSELMRSDAEDTLRETATANTTVRQQKQPMGLQAGTAEDNVAAVDLGSNSFHMIVAREKGGQLQVIDRLRDPVRLAAGLTEDSELDRDARTRALQSLSRFGQRLGGIPANRVRAVGTNTLRKLRADDSFIADAEQALGHEIEVISGLEEARLVFAAVIRGGGNLPPRRLVIDIGGGSTELIIGRGLEPRLIESVGMGCVVYTSRFFSSGAITRSAMRDARLAARVQLEFLAERYRRDGWDIALGASGTIRGVWRVIRSQGWGDEIITKAALEKAVAMTVASGHTDKIDFPGLREDRRPIFAGGLAVLAGVFDALTLDFIQTSDQALREGVVYDLLGRLADRDARSDAVAAMARRYSVDQGQARNVEWTALRLFAQVSSFWSIDPIAGRNLLSWAAQLHEIGLAISHDGYQRHGEYILRHGDLIGFSRTDQCLLAALVRLQRGKFSNGVVKEVPPAWRRSIRLLAVLFRLSVLLHRSRTAKRRSLPTVEVSQKGLILRFKKGWLERHPLTRADLEVEREALKGVPFRLEFS